jgi:hypothetical protein
MGLEDLADLPPSRGDIRVLTEHIAFRVVADSDVQKVSTDLHVVTGKDTADDIALGQSQLAHEPVVVQLDNASFPALSFSRRAQLRRSLMARSDLMVSDAMGLGIMLVAVEVRGAGITLAPSLGLRTIPGVEFLLHHHAAPAHTVRVFDLLGLRMAHRSSEKEA